MKRTFYGLIFLIIITLNSCVSQQTSTIVGCDYNESKNQTDYFELPFGSVSLPGKWEKKDYRPVSGQQFFMNKDSVSIAIAFNRFNKYEFNQNGALKGMDFLNGYFDWESEYFKESFGLDNRKIENDTVHNFIIFQLFGNYNGNDFDTFQLIGDKNGNITNVSVSITNKWTEETKLNFLKDLYLKK